MSAPGVAAAHAERVTPAHAEAGTSLVEVMLGAVLAVVGLVGILMVTTHVARLRRVDQDLELAFQACRNTMEELRSLPAATVVTLDGADFDVPGPRGTARFLRALPSDPDGMAGEIAVQIVDPDPLLLRVSARATWQRGGGKQTFGLETMMGDRP